MPPLLFISIIYFLFVSFIASSSFTTSFNAFLDYYALQAKFLSNNRGVFLFGIVFIFIIFFVYNILKRKEILENFLIATRRIVAIFVTGSLITFLFLYLIAFAELNLLSFISYASPKLLGVESDTKTIIQNINKLERPPVLIAGENSRRILAVTIAIASAGKDNFYARKVVSDFPVFLILPARKTNSGVLQVGDSLIISEINSSEFQNISPVIANLMIQRYFPKQIIKKYPKVELMSNDEYKNFRKNDFENKFKKFDEVISQIREDEKNLTDSLDRLRTQISDNETEVANLSSQREKEFTSCVNEGYYKSGEYVKTNTKEYCTEQIKDTEDKLTELKNNGDELKSTLQSNLAKIAQYQSFDKYYSNQMTLTQEASTYVSYEFGTFEPPDKIKIALVLQNNSQAVADYLELLVHEYLHYMRYEENGLKLGSAFFDEGLTEYFARKIIQQSMSTNTNLGYPVNVKIVSQIAKRIADTDLADIYFTNDMPSLEKHLDKVYGKDFYEQNAVLFETLHYSANTDQLLQIGSDIMSEMGGEPLKKEDLQTTYSTFK